MMKNPSHTRERRSRIATVRRVDFSEVSPWLPLAVAALGILGVITGQIIHSWRENRRVREQIRHDMLKHWRDQRIEVYSNFFAAVQDWCEVASKVTLNNIADPTSTAALALWDRCETNRKRARTALARIDLIGSETVFKHAEDVYMILRGWSVDALDGVLPNRTSTGSNQGLFAVDDAVDTLRRTIRADLAVADAD